MRITPTDSGWRLETSAGESITLTTEDALRLAPIARHLQDQLRSRSPGAQMSPVLTHPISDVTVSVDAAHSAGSAAHRDSPRRSPAHSRRVPLWASVVLPEAGQAADEDFHGQFVLLSLVGRLTQYGSDKLPRNSHTSPLAAKAYTSSLQLAPSRTTAI